VATLARFVANAIDASFADEPRKVRLRERLARARAELSGLQGS
jgi:hypothetical protein